MSAIDLDFFQSVIETTCLNPLITIPVFLGHCVNRGAPLRATELSSLLVIASLIREFNAYLNDRTQNNWTSDKYDWRKEIVVVTGGSTGIGAAVVKELFARNIYTIIIDIVEPTVSIAPSHFYRCDLSVPAEISATILAIQNDHGNPTVLFNNAGDWNRTPLIKTSYEDISRIFHINSLAQYQLIKGFLPSMISNNHGMLITMSSVIAYGTAPPAMVDYAATKVANVALHESISSELAVVYQAPKVRTVLVVPNFTRTPLTEGIDPQSALYRNLEPEELAEGIVRQMLSGRSGQVVLPKSCAWTEAYCRALRIWMARMKAVSPLILRAQRASGLGTT